jgi:hypothetical protein
MISRVSRLLDNATTIAIDMAKLGRTGLFSSLLQAPMGEPNIGPFPQYNIIFEDEPIDELLSSTGGMNRKYQSAHRKHLVDLLNRSVKQLARTQAILLNPRSQTEKSVLNQARAATSFLQDYEQFVEHNVAPYQQIFIKEEAATPVGGDAPIISLAKPRILDVNRTAEILELKALEAEEKRILKVLRKIAISLVK